MNRKCAEPDAERPPERIKRSPPCMPPPRAPTPLRAATPPRLPTPLRFPPPPPTAFSAVAALQPDEPLTIISVGDVRPEETTSDMIRKIEIMYKEQPGEFLRVSEAMEGIVRDRVKIFWRNGSSPS